MAFVQSLKRKYNTPSLRAMSIYTFANFLGKGLSFLLIPLFTNPKFLTTSDNGLLSLFSQAVLFLSSFISLGILKSASVDYFKLDNKRFRDFFTTGFFMSVVMTMLSFIVFLLFRNYFTKTYSFPSIFIWVIPLAAFMTFCYELVLIAIRNRDNALLFMKVSSLRISGELGLAVLFIVLFGWGWFGRIAGILIALFIINGFAISYFRKAGFLSGAIHKDIILSELKFSVPVILLQLSIFCLFSSDSFLIAGITGNTSLVGIYGTACVFGSIIITLSSALQQYMIPKISQSLALALPKAYGSLRNLFLTYLSIMLFAFVTLWFTVPAIYHLFINERYWPGIRFYYLLSSGYFFWALASFFYNFLIYDKKKRQIFSLSVFSIIISLSSNYIFISKMGAWGASISVCCSYFFVLVLLIVFTRKYWLKMIKN
jgi:O-antigen/teichoic acid export membrane protein